MGNRKEIIHKYRLLFNFLSSLHPLMSYPEVQFAFIQHFSASLIRSRRQAIISSLKYFLGNCWDHTGFYGSLALLEIPHLNHPSWHWEEERRSSITAQTANNRTPNVYIKSALTHMQGSVPAFEVTPPPLGDPLYQLWQMHYHAAVVVCLFLFRSCSTLHPREPGNPFVALAVWALP